MLQTKPTQSTYELFSASELLRCDFVAETFAKGVRFEPGAAFLALADKITSRSSFHGALSSRLRVDATALLYDETLIARMSEARARGLNIAIIPDLPMPWSEAIAAHLGASVYRGDIADTAAKSEVAAESGKVLNVYRKSDKGILRQICAAMRIYQWPKNALVFLPLLLAQKFDDASLVVASLLAFLAIGFAASTIYVINDLMDVGSDRQHPSKRWRPFASGAIPARWGFLLAAFSLSMAIGISYLLPSMFLLTLATYLLVNIVYTSYLKRKLLVDVLALAGSYTLRILAGNAATGIELSFWLLAFSIFLFFSLALVKRYVEMDTIGATQVNEKRVMGRGYRYVDLEMLSQMGVASAFSAVLVLALYVERAGATGLYTHPELIWLICPIVLYVISRIWFLAKRGEMKDDPVAFVMRDWRSHLMGVVVTGIMIAASW